jgi:hypothetical protein
MIRPYGPRRAVLALVLSLLFRSKVDELPMQLAGGTTPAAAPTAAQGTLDIHRIGGGAIENLRLKPREATLDRPGISVLKAPSPAAAAQQMRAAFPTARVMHAASKTVGSTTEALSRTAGFDIIHVPSKTFPNHYRIIHPDGAAGFNDANLARLSQVFTNTTGH